MMTPNFCLSNHYKSHINFVPDILYWIFTIPELRFLQVIVACYFVGSHSLCFSFFIVDAYFYGNSLKLRFKGVHLK